MIETLAMPDPLQGVNGRTALYVAGPADAASGAVIAAPGMKLYVVGKYNSHDQCIPIDPDEVHIWAEALERARAISAGDRPVTPPGDRTVIGALRLALVEGYAKDDQQLAVARAILEEAFPSDGSDTAPVHLLVAMIQRDRLKAEVTA
jgi:hypothetical protein